ncbi:MAG: ABC transporter permease, partial [Angustibacter sp.]
MAIVTRTRGGADPTGQAPVRSRRKLTPYLLLLPGFVWLFFFFVAPLGTLAGTSTQTRVPGGEIGEFQQTFRLANYWEAVQEYQEQFLRSFTYATIATVLCLLIGYPLAYAIALKGGRWKNTLLVLVIAPFFCSFVLRTIAWKQI